MANNLPPGFVLDSNPDYTTPPPSGNTGQVAASAPPKVVLDVPATGGGGLPEGFVPDAPSKPATQPTAADLAAVQQAMNQSAPWRGIPLLGQAGGLIQDIATAKPQTPNYQPSAIPALDPIDAFTNRFVNKLPVIGPMLTDWGNNVDSTINNLIPGMQHETPQDRSQINARTDAAYPTYAAAGELAGTGAGYGLLGAYAPGAMGLTGGLGRQMLMGGLSTTGIQTADNIARGQPVEQALQNAIAPGAFAAALPVGGALAERFIAQPVADAFTNMRQRSATNAASANSLDSAGLRQQAGASFGMGVDSADVPVLQPSTIDGFVQSVADALRRYRVNKDSDPGAIGVLKQMIQMQRDSRTTPVDLKDFHMLRQSAGDLLTSAKPRERAIGAIITDKIDSMMNGLKPADILSGSANPQAKVAALMRGISTWKRAQKAAIIERAIEAAKGYASGEENGLRLQFLKIMRAKDFTTKWTKAEQQAIREAAKGTTLSNILSAIGKLGFKFTGTGHNIIGGTIGAGVLTPMLGPAGLPASMVASHLARAGAERMALNSANRAARVVATPDIPSVAPSSVPSILPQLLGAGGLGVRALLAAQAGNANP